MWVDSRQFYGIKGQLGTGKIYAMLNIEKYQNVAIGETVSECEENYRQLMVDSGIVDETAAETQRKAGR